MRTTKAGLRIKFSSRSNLCLEIDCGGTRQGNGDCLHDFFFACFQSHDLVGSGRIVNDPIGAALTDRIEAIRNDHDQSGHALVEPAPQADHSRLIEYDRAALSLRVDAEVEALYGGKRVDVVRDVV